MRDEVICSYKGKCTSEGCKCNTCERNTGKRDYYKPRQDWYIPYYPRIPWYPTTTPYPYLYITWYDNGTLWQTSNISLTYTYT